MVPTGMVRPKASVDGARLSGNQVLEVGVTAGCALQRWEPSQSESFPELCAEPS